MKYLKLLAAFTHFTILMIVVITIPIEVRAKVFKSK